MAWRSRSQSRQVRRVLRRSDPYLARNGVVLFDSPDVAYRSRSGRAVMSGNAVLTTEGSAAPNISDAIMARGDHIRTVATTAGRDQAPPAVLIRPDGYIAWVGGRRAGRCLGAAGSTPGCRLTCCLPPRPGHQGITHSMPRRSGKTALTANWRLRYGATMVVYGRLHIPRTTRHHDVRLEKVSLGYPRERHGRSPS
jgi:hypothetical protein